jgi:zinc/manganese transport system substrate-binding protein
MKAFSNSLLFAAILHFTASLQAEIKVATLHPLLADLVEQVGGKNVSVTNLLKPGAEVHHFEPTSKDLASLKGVNVLLASGKGAEPYLGKLSDSLGPAVKMIEVGATLPSIKTSNGNVDPHWWHSPDNMKRAARVIGDELAIIDTPNAALYKANATAAGLRIDAVKSWATQQLATIPKADRTIVSAHNAFGYFCKAFGFRAIPLLGLQSEDETTPKQIAEAISAIRELKVRAVFPEDQANPKVLAEITRETGAKIGKPLVADGTAMDAHTFEKMIRHNVEALVEGLK